MHPQHDLLLLLQTDLRSLIHGLREIMQCAEQCQCAIGTAWLTHATEEQACITCICVPGGGEQSSRTQTNTHRHTHAHPHTHTHTHTHTHLYMHMNTPRAAHNPRAHTHIYIYMCVCVYVILISVGEEFGNVSWLIFDKQSWQHPEVFPGGPPDQNYPGPAPLNLRRSEEIRCIPRGMAASGGRMKWSH